MIGFSLLFAFLLPFLIFSFLLKRSPEKFSSSKHKKLPPSPPKLPILGNIHNLGKLPHRSLWALSKCHGPLMLFHLGNKPLLVVCSVDGARQIMKDNDLAFSNRPQPRVAYRLLYGCKDIVFSQYGKYWRHLRSLCMIHLLNSKRVQYFRRVREEEMSFLIEEIIRQSVSSSNSSINLSNMFVSLTRNIVSRIALGRKCSGGEEGKKLTLMLKEFTEVFGSTNIADYVPWLGWINHINGFNAKVERVAKVLDELLEGVVQDHRNKREENNWNDSSEDGGEDFVDILLDLQRNGKDDIQIEHNSVKAIILDMFVAGIDTTYTTLEWAMTELIRHPKVFHKLKIEVRETDKKKKTFVTEEDIDKMHYLKAVIKETLRLHPPAPLLLPRESSKETNILGYQIPASTQVTINAWAIGRDPLYWPNPEEFQPERFLENDIDHKGLHFQLIPFGSGRRGCPGIAFAEPIMELTLANLANKFYFELPNGTNGKDLDTIETNGLTVQRKFPLCVKATSHF